MTHPPQPTPLHTVRIDWDLWRDAQDEAAHRGETVSDAIRRSLKRYTRERRAKRAATTTD